MFTLFIILLVIIIVIVFSRKDKHNVAQDQASIALLPSFEVNARPMTTFSKCINLAFAESQLLKYFSFSNGMVTIVTQDGNFIYSLLNELSVSFQKYSGNINYTINGKGKQLAFYQTTNITDKEWDAINSTLCLAGTTWGRYIFSKEAKYANYVQLACKAINSLT